MNDRYIETPYGRVFGKQSGPEAGPLVLGLHGWSQRNGWHTWEPLLAPLAAAGFNVVSVDMPGWGQSPSPGGGALQTAAAVATVVALLDGLGKGSAALMGKSWGGGIALQVALAYPQRVDKLILTAPAFREIARLPEIACPVLLAWAEDDPVIPLRYAGAFVDGLPDVEFVSYPTGGHSAAPKNAGDFAPRAIRFLQSAPATD